MQNSCWIIQTGLELCPSTLDNKHQDQLFVSWNEPREAIGLKMYYRGKGGKAHCISAYGPIWSSRIKRAPSRTCCWCGTPLGSEIDLFYDYALPTNIQKQPWWPLTKERNKHTTVTGYKRNIFTHWRNSTGPLGVEVFDRRIPFSHDFKSRSVLHDVARCLVVLSLPMFPPAWFIFLVFFSNHPKRRCSLRKYM